MKKRRLGKTEIMVSPIGYGVMANGVTPETIMQGIRGGINFLDSAREYIDSEVKIGRMLKDLDDRSSVIITTKSPSRSLEEFRSDFSMSIKKMETEYIDIMFLHNVSTAKCWESVKANGLIDEMYYLKKQKKIRYLGISTHNEGDIAEDIIRSGHFEVIMLAYNAANPEAGDYLIPLAKSFDLGIVVMKPYGGGILTEKRSRDLGFEISSENALKWVLSNPDVSVVIPGLDKKEYVEHALKILNSDFTAFPDEKLEAIHKSISIRGSNYCRNCRYCLPCPQNIPIPEILSIYNRWEVYYEVDWSQMDIISNDFITRIPAEIGSERCVKCNLCVKKCPYNLAIPYLLEQSASIRNHTI